MLVNFNTFPPEIFTETSEAHSQEKNIFKLGKVANLSVRLGFRVDKAAGDVSSACSQRLGTGLRSDRDQVALGGDAVAAVCTYPLA